MNEKKILTIKKTFALAFQNHQKHNFKVAENLYKEILKIDPNHADAYSNLGTILQESGKSKKAMSCYQKAIQINPNHASAHSNLGNILQELGEPQKAMSCYQKAIQINPNHINAHYNFGNVLRELGEYQKAISYYEKAIYLKPDYVKAHSNILFTLLHIEKYDPNYYLSKTKKFRSSLKSINDDLLLRYQFDDKPEKLKIGFVSGDFRKQPVGFFLLDTLGHLKNKNLELIAYSNSQKKDSLRVKLKTHFTDWHEIADQNDVEVVNQIRKDGIHILIDLSGHSKKNRLPIFVNKPAPIQVSWAGYLGTSCLSEIDYMIGDPYVTPKKNIEYFTEKIFLLPNRWCCFSVPEFDVKIKEIPAIKNGYITFGCFNNLSKINDKVITLWSRILKEIPKSKIFLKTKKLDNIYFKNKIINNFRKNSINSDSIILEGQSSRDEYFASYNKIDIALDPFPYSGGTISYDAVWMGTPVLTKKGFIFASRQTESTNHNINMSDWIANNENEYVDKAIKFSTNIERLSEININLRQTALKSPLFDSQLFAEQFKVAFWKMWNDFI